MRELSLFLVFVCLVFGAVAGVQTVSTAGDLVRLFEKATLGTLKQDIELQNDLDFSQYHLPLGASSDGTCISYSGVFEGKGFSIKNLQMDNTNTKGYNHAGLFCNLKGATIQNLTIDSSCSFIGNWSGGLSVTATGSLTFTNVTNNANVNGTEQAGGFIGYVKEKGGFVKFNNCQNFGNTHIQPPRKEFGDGDYYFGSGGFVGQFWCDNGM